ncbi:MAG: HD domain-containing protein [Clostridium sp.]|nr:HD domain-containing protein [Clostridium sp.]
MSFRELFKEEEFKAVFDEVEQFTDIMLKDYNNWISQNTLSEDNKEIFDAVWGNVEFSSGEIGILDSPLLQRLRKIKQLGLAYFVYCGCDYSRYYHTLGVTYLADRMASAINRCDLGTKDTDKKFFKAVVRLAAIFHDSGHMFLSHVSEHYFAKSPHYNRNTIIKALMDKFERIAGKRSALHEILGCMIVNTQAVQDLLEIVTKYIKGLKTGRNYTIDELVEYISALIVGVPVDREVLPYASIVNGPIDADKCDYLSRDSHVTRVPVAVDISRITQKLSVVESFDINQSELWHKDAKEDVKLYELAMQDSAEKALFQLCIARTIMFDSVYYHHKVLTAETEFRSLINRLANLKSPCFTDFKEILSYTDEDFNRYFFEDLKRNRNEEDCKEIDAIYEKLTKIYNRQLPKRVVCLTPDYVLGAQKYTEPFWDSVMTVFDSKEEKEFIREIKEEYQKTKRFLKKTGADSDDIQIFAIQAPTQVLGHSKIQVPIDLRNGRKRDFRGYELVSSRETSSSSSYIVTDEDDKLMVYLAVEKIFIQKYHIILKEEAAVCGKYASKDMNAMRRQLFSAGYYDDAPELISNTLLHNHIATQKINKIVDKFRGYEGPEGYKITKESTETFFKQVMGVCDNKKDCKSLLQGMYILLQSALIIDRDYICTKLAPQLEKMAKGTNELYMVPLGGLRDSARHMTYFWNDVQVPGLIIETEKGLEELLEMDEVNKIIFYDDGSYSGTQLISIMQEYMGISKRRTKEHHVQELSDCHKEVLKKKQIEFFFFAFNRNSEQEIANDLREMGLQNVVFEYIEDMSTSCLEAGGMVEFENDEQRELVKSVLKEIGISVLNSTKMENDSYKDGWNKPRIEKAALGYNDAQQMIFLKSSVPTYTITAFWAEGQYKGMEWKPLFRRTKK